jgi:serine/threonine-protein kinase
MVTLWSLDSQRIVFQSYREGVPGLFSVSADGRGEVQRLLLGDSPEVSQMLSPESWSADGKQLAFTYNPGLNMGVLSIEDGAWKPLLATPAAEDTLAISPRGGWIAYESNDTGHYEVYVERFPEMGGRVQISAGGGRHPVWSRDERELYYRRADRAVMAAPISSGPKLAASTPRLLFEGRDYALVALGCPGGPRSYDLHPDSKRFLMVKGTTNDASGSSRLVLIQNWHEELKRLVPIP